MFPLLPNSTRYAAAFCTVVVGLVTNLNAQDALLELPKTPLVVADGLEATLFASEPMINAPTNMAIDHRGRVWINEGVNYREERQADGDRIVILEDTDGDGMADTSRIFYQGTDVNAAMGLSVLGNMAIVSSAPNILLLTDTDGDDKADHKKMLFTGMGGSEYLRPLFATPQQAVDLLFSLRSLRCRRCTPR